MRMLLAGGQGSRLYVLTGEMAKPAVPFGGKYRIIDFPLSNCCNSGIDTVGVLTQYRPLELNSYIGSGQPWDLDGSSGGVHILPPYMAEDFSWNRSARQYLNIYSAITGIPAPRPENPPAPQAAAAPNPEEIPAEQEGAPIPVGMSAAPAAAEPEEAVPAPVEEEASPAPQSAAAALFEAAPEKTKSTPPSKKAATGKKRSSGKSSVPARSLSQKTARTAAKKTHGDIPQKKREQVMEQFRGGNLRVFVATDVAARGIDVDDVDIVFNCDVPDENQDYVHRIGRTGRAKRQGVAVSLIADYPAKMRMDDIARHTKNTILPVRFGPDGKLEEIPQN